VNFHGDSHKENSPEKRNKCGWQSWIGIYL
jgi:hypothetical protein